MSEVLDRQFKKYVLIDAIKSTAKYFQKVRGEQGDGIRLDTPRRVPIHLQHTFVHKDGKQRTIRYKQGVPSIFQDEQIKNFSVPANERFTDDERRAMNFVNGVLVHDGEHEQKFLDKDHNPQREDFTGRRIGQITPLFKELDEELEEKEENSFLKNTGLALVKILSMGKAEVSALLSLFYGASYVVPATLSAAQNAAAKALEGNEDRMKMVNEWGSDKDVDSKIIILLNKALGKGIVSFDLHDNQVSLLKNNEWRDVKMISGDSYEEREVLFRQYLATEQGELLRKDIESLVKDEVKEEVNEEVKEEKQEGKGKKK